MHAAIFLYLMITKALLKRNFPSVFVCQFICLRGFDTTNKLDHDILVKYSISSYIIRLFTRNFLFRIVLPRKYGTKIAIYYRTLELGKMKNIIFLLLGLFFMVDMNGQDAQASVGSLNEGTIESQFNFLIKKSNNYQQYKVVRKDFINKFYQNIADSLKVNNNEIAKLNNTIYTQQINVDSMKSQVMTLNTDLTQVNKEKDSFSLFGILLSKGTYNTLLWSLILGLLAALSLFIYRFKRSHVVTSKAKENLSKTKEEFDAFRKKTLEKEQVLMRRLQDELNKNEMNMG